MPLPKPKPVKMPLPFADPEKSSDDTIRQQAIWMKIELQDDPAYSWNRPRRSLWRRILDTPPHKWLSSLMALLMGCAVTVGFLYFMGSGIRIPTNIIFMESWSAERTAEDAVRDRDEAIERLRQRIEANRQAQERELARQQALDAERRAARETVL